ASKLRFCFLKPGMEEEARFSEIASCQRALAFIAAAAWYRLTFTAHCKQWLCHAVKAHVSWRFCAGQSGEAEKAARRGSREQHFFPSPNRPIREDVWSS